MAITPIQQNIDNTKSYQSYRTADKPIKTDKYIKPLSPQGHLVHDTISSVPKYWIKDIEYDVQAIKDGLQGKANDHQIGRLNNVGLVLGGTGIAGYLASKTSDPKARIMEYVGLISFLTAMSLYPKIAINAPSRVIQGYDIGKQYIDDQGRKKSVFQDPNYIPFDMYKGDYIGENLSVIGDRMGIPRDIKNRDALIQEQMRKIAIQNNTLWMLTAGVGTPVLAALMCCGFEKLLPSMIEKTGNAKYNSQISKMLAKTQEMTLNADEISSNDLSNHIEKILKYYEGKELPNAELNNIIDIITKETDSNLSEGIKEDLKKIFKSDKNGFSNHEKLAENIVDSIKYNIPDRNKQTLEKIFIPSNDEIQAVINRVVRSDSKEISQGELKQIREELKALFDGKIEQETSVSKDFLKAYRSKILENISADVQKNEAYFVNNQNMKEVVDFAKIIGEFKKNQKVLDKCKSFKFEEIPTSVIAKSYSEFESTLFDVLDIKYSELKKMRASEALTKEVLEQKLADLAKDEAKYEKAVAKLGKVISKMEMSLNGKAEDTSYIADLISALENNYNNTAKRLDQNGNGKFQNTIDKLVKEDVSTLSNTVSTREDVFKFLDGTNSPKGGLGWVDYARENAKGIGSSKNMEISRILDRYQGVKNSFYRMIHAMDLYKQTAQTGYDSELLEKGREILLTADSTQHTLKFNTVNSPEYYKDIMNKIWNENNLSETAKQALGKDQNLSNGNVLRRFQEYIIRFKNVMGNNSIDFTKPSHNLGLNPNYVYTPSSLTRMAKFNLVAQSPVDFVKNAANRKYGNQKWLRIAGGIFGAVVGGAVLTQFCFGKIKNPHNIIKQVIDDTNS